MINVRQLKWLNDVYVQAKNAIGNFVDVFKINTDDELETALKSKLTGGLKAPYSQILIVDKNGLGDYTTIQAAINSITDESLDKVYTVLVFPGEYDDYTLTPYINVVKVDESSTVINSVKNVALGHDSKVVNGVRNFAVSNFCSIAGRDNSAGGKYLGSSDYTFTVIDNNTVDVIGVNVSSHFVAGKPAYFFNDDGDIYVSFCEIVSATYASGNTRIVKTGGKGFVDDFYESIYKIVGNVDEGGEGGCAEGICNHAEGYASHAEGQGGHAEGNASHTEGNNTHAEGVYTHAEGHSSHAEGEASHAEGEESHAEGYTSHAEGLSSHAEGNSSHAEGSTNHAEGNSSHAEGNYSHAYRNFQHSQASGCFSIAGDAQMGRLVMRKSTTNNTPTQLFINGSSTKFNLESDKCYTFQIMITAKNVTDSYSASWIIEGRVDDLGGTAHYEEMRNVFSETADSTFASTDVAVSVVEGSPDELKIAVTGQSSKTIRWVGLLTWVEVL